MSKLLLLSNSTMPGKPFFAWPREYVKSFLGEKTKNLVFIPFAAVTFAFDEYEEIVRKAFNEMGYSIYSIHGVSDKYKSIKEAECIVVGGGNSFALLERMHKEELMELVQEKINEGVPYVGWSAGANLACPTIKTTNDMPIVQPPSFEALHLIPFQINPHYHELKFENQGGETRKERLEEFLMLNPDRKVIGLPEGMLLEKENDKLFLRGEGVAKLYQVNNPIQRIKPDSDLSYLLA